MRVKGPWIAGQTCDFLPVWLTRIPDSMTLDEHGVLAIHKRSDRLCDVSLCFKIDFGKLDGVGGCFFFPALDHSYLG